MFDFRKFVTLNWIDCDDDDANPIPGLSGLPLFSQDDKTFTEGHSVLMSKIAETRHASMNGDTSLAIAFNEAAARTTYDPFVHPVEFWAAMDVWAMTGVLPDAHPLDTADVGATIPVGTTQGTATATKTETGVAVEVKPTVHHSGFTVFAHNVGAALRKVEAMLAGLIHKL